MSQSVYDFIKCNFNANSDFERITLKIKASKGFELVGNFLYEDFWRTVGLQDACKHYGIESIVTKPNKVLEIIVNFDPFGYVGHTFDIK